MAQEVLMPQFGMTQEEATIIKWFVADGDQVEFEDPLAEVTTDKVNMEVPSPAEGLVGGIRFAEGDTVPVTEIIAFILEEGEAVPELPPAAPSTETTSTVSVSAADKTRVEPHKASPVAERMATVEGLDLADVDGSGTDGRILRRDVEAMLSTPVKGSLSHKVRATPSARRAARERDLDLELIPGSGPRGRIQQPDVLAFQPEQIPSRPHGHLAEPVLVPLEGMRKTIAERMQASAQQAPHITFTLDVEMSRAIAFRNSLNNRLSAGQPKVSMTALLVKLTAWALRKHPFMNAYMQTEGILLLPDVNIGVAVALESGLIVPVVRYADQKGLFEIASNVVDITQRARQGQLQPDDVVDGSFTISNMGMFDIDSFTAIINPPQTGILAVGRTVERFVPDEDGQPELRPILSLTLSADHRAVDGAQAGQFIADLRSAIEEPANTLL